MTTTVQKERVTEISEIHDVLKNKLCILFDSDSTENKILRVELNIPKIDIIDWFQKQDIDEKLFWSDRDDKFTLAGIYFADIMQNGNDQTHPELFQKIQSRLIDADNSVRYFGGLKFDTSSVVTDRWKNFGTAAFILPRFELLKRYETYQFVCNINLLYDSGNQEEIFAQLSQINFSQATGNFQDNKILKRIDFPNRDQWVSRVNSALTDMNNNKYEKIVLARKTELLFADNIRADRVLSDLYQNSSNCFHFCFQFSSTNAFLGATPERLYYRNDTTLKCEAVAGTRSRGDDETHDKSLADELLQSKKEIQEHRYVIDSIIESLENYVIESKEENNTVLLIKLVKVQHLIKRFKFLLKDSITDFDLVSSLHPTAAVGGYPKNNILHEIAELEQFDRGWYAAPIGWISKNTSEFAVAIRSGIIHKNKMTLYSGAGIINGSIPELEWDEIENKISNFLKILNS